MAPLRQAAILPRSSAAGAPPLSSSPCLRSSPAAAAPEMGPHASREARPEEPKGGLSSPETGTRRATGGREDARQGNSTLHREERWGDQSGERGAQRTAEESRSGQALTTAHLKGHTGPGVAALTSLVHCRGLGRARGGGAALGEGVPRMRRPDVTRRTGSFGAGRARFRAEPEAPAVVASGTASERANPDWKVRSGTWPALQARLVLAALH